MAETNGASLLEIGEELFKARQEIDRLNEENRRLRQRVAEFYNKSCREITDTIESALMAWHVKVRLDNHAVLKRED